MIETRTPEQIRKDRERERRRYRENELRAKFLLEYEFIALPRETKKQIKLDILDDLGYDKDKPIAKQGLLLRILYYRRENDLSRDSYVIDYYGQNRTRYNASELRGPDHRTVDGDDAGRAGATENIVYRASRHAVPQEVF